MTDQTLLTRALAQAPAAALARLMGVNASTVFRWQAGGALPASKRRWLERWTRSHPDLQQALLFWANPRNFPNPEEEE